MDQLTIETFGRRLEKIERENRTVKRVGAIMVVGIGLLVIMAQAGPQKTSEVISAERFVVTDGTGKVRAFFGVGDHGEPMLVFFDRADNQRVNLGVGYDGMVALEFYDRNKKKRIALGVLEPNSSPTIALTDKDGNIAWATESLPDPQNFVLWSVIPRGAQGWDAIAVGAGLSKNSCEQELERRKKSGILFVCLPVNVNPIAR